MDDYDIDVKLSDTETGDGIYHDWRYRYPKSNRGANADTATFTCKVDCGNSLSVKIKTYDGATYELDNEVIELEFTLHGAIEFNDFCALMNLIDTSHKVTRLLGGTANAT